jgi:hypothetical protein
MKRGKKKEKKTLTEDNKKRAKETRCKQLIYFSPAMQTSYAFSSTMQTAT